MASVYFSVFRNMELSLLEYLQTQLNASWTGITTVKTFKNVYSKNVSVPIVTARMLDLGPETLEIGATTLDPKPLFSIDIFAISQAQRLDLAAFLTDKLKDSFDYQTYAHASGDKSTIEGTVAGKLKVITWITNAPLDFGEQVEVKDRYRHNISIQIRKST